MMQNSVEHALLWPHPFIILTQGPVLTLYEAEKGAKKKKNEMNKTIYGQSTAELREFSFNIRVHSLYKHNLAANQV